MKKITAMLLGVVSAFCFTANVFPANDTAVAYAETNNASVVLSETKYKVSDNEDKMILVTAIQNYENVYEVGYEFSEGYSVGEGATAETTVYYDTITTHAKQDAEDIFGAEYADAKLIVWEVAYAENISFNAYALEGVIEGGNLVVPEEEIKVVSETRTIEAEAPALPTEDKVVVDKTNLISKISNTSCSAGTALFGNLTSSILDTVPAEDLACGIKNSGWEGAVVTFDVEVGDVSQYKHLEMHFWVLARYGQLCSLSLADGTSLIANAGVRVWTDPVTVQIPVSAVKDGKLSFKFSQVYGQYNAELYIQYIKAIAPEAGFVKPTVDKRVIDTTNLISKISNTSCSGGTALFGNLTSSSLATMPAEALAYGIKNSGWEGAVATFDVEVGDVSAYDHLEMQFWVLARNGQSCSLSLADGTSLIANAQVRLWDNPITVQIPVSAVKDGKLTFKFSQVYSQYNAELYIQYIDAKV